MTMRTPSTSAMIAGRLEQRLLSLLDGLHVESAENAGGEVRSQVIALRDVAESLDATDLRQAAVRELYRYLDATSRDFAVSRARERIDIENALACAHAASRHGDSPLALSCVRSQLDELAHRIDDLEPEDREPLRHLLSYVDFDNRAALALVIQRDWGAPGAFRRVETIPERRGAYGSAGPATDTSATRTTATGPTDSGARRPARPASDARSLRIVIRDRMP